MAEQDDLFEKVASFTYGRRLSPSGRPVLPKKSSKVKLFSWLEAGRPEGYGNPRNLLLLQPFHVRKVAR